MLNWQNRALTKMMRGARARIGQWGRMAGLAFSLGWLLAALALAGCLYTLAAAILVGGYRAGPLPPLAAPPAVSVLKPLHGAEPRLRDNLETLMAQRHAAPVQIVFGVADGNDPAVAVAAALKAAYPEADIEIIIDATRHGGNAKVSNLVNIARAARHPLIVPADSDVAWPPDTLHRLAAALAEPGVGLASCLHWGRGDAGFWSVLGAMDISYRFLPSIVIGIATGLATPTLGPTLALRRETLDAIGGFKAFADVLADDYEIGRAVRRQGLATVVPRFTIGHSGDEARAGALIRHELRWTRTIRGLDPRGFAGSAVTHCFALALGAAALAGFGTPSLALVGAALFCRIVLVRAVDRATGTRAGPLLLLPLRDGLSAALFLAAFFINNVTWRGTRYRVAPDGRISLRN